MFEKQEYLRSIPRFAVSEGRDLAKGLRLDRNEKVDTWPHGFLASVIAAKPDYFLSVYPETTALYDKLARHLGLKREQLLITSGIDGGLKTLFEIMTDPGDSVAVLGPTYAMYKVYSNLFRTKLIEVSYKEDLTIDRDQLKASFDAKPKMLFIPNPNQPIESAFSLAELTEMAKEAKKRDILFVVDEAYYLFGCDTAMPLLETMDNVVVTRTFSKGFGAPAIRLGFIASTAKNMEIFSKTRFAHETNALSGAVAEYLLDNYHLVQANIDRVIEGRTYVKNALAELGVRVHGGKGNYLLLDLRSEEVAKKVVADLKKQLVYVKGPWSAPWSRYITITVGPLPQMKRFIEVVMPLLETHLLSSASA